MNSVEQFIQATERDEKTNLKSFILIKNNKVIATYNKSPYNFDDLHLLFSIAKSFTSIGIGIARDKGLMDLNAKLIDVFPDKLPDHVSENLSKVTVRHLLTMSSGITDDKVIAITKNTTDWVREFLQLDFIKEPGTHYYYSTLGSHILSEVFTRVTGDRLSDFLDENLFQPLGIEDYEWGMSPAKATLGGMGISLPIASLSKVGLMLLHNGMYNNKRILSKEYIKEATSSKIEKSGKKKIYSGNTYGYQFHIMKDGYFSMQGAFGQLCLIAPDKDLVLSLTSVNSGTSENILKYVYEYFLNDKLSITNNSNYKGSYTLPDFDMNYKNREELKNREYILDKNKNKFDRIIINQEGKILNVTIVTTTKEELNVTFNFTKKVEGRGIFVKDSFYSEQKYLSFAKWLNEKELLLTIYYLETSYIVDYKLTFIENEVEIDFHVNVNLTINNETFKGRMVLD